MMLGLVAAWASSYEVSLHWANRKYAELCASSLTVSGMAADEVRSAFDEVAQQHGPTWQTSMGIARCLGKAGRYELAESVYSQLDSRLTPVGERREARLKARWAVALANAAPRGFRLRGLSRIPGKAKGWCVAAWAKPDRRLETNVRESEFSCAQATRVQLFRVSPSSGRIISVGDLVSPDLHGWDMIREVSVRGVMLDGRATPAVLFDIHFLGGDSAPCVLIAYRVVKDRLVKVQSFWGKDWTKVLQPSPGGPVVIGCTPTWKVWWTDYYEYAPAGFRLDNRKYARFYPMPTSPDADDRRSYQPYLWNACLSAVHGDKKGALSYLRTAERVCERTVYYDKHPSARPTWFNPGDYHEFGFYGDATENLKQIRQRMAWVRKGDLNHMLLYRPYDWDLQVPPYRLGKAGL
jgi:hypothetical protein